MTDAPDDEFDAIVDDDDDDDDATVSKAEFDRTKAALKRANADGKKHRLRAKELSEQLAKKNSGDTSTDDKDTTRARELERQSDREEAAEETASKFKLKLLNKASQAALLQAGLMGSPEKLARLVGLDDVDVDDDGEVDEDQLDEAIEKIKDDYPELFRDKEEKQRTQTRRSRIDSGDKGRQTRQRPMSSAQKIQAKALGRSSR